MLTCDLKTACEVYDDVVSPTVSDGDTCGVYSEVVPDIPCICALEVCDVSD